MKDRYLFKAKRTDNGEWVKGALVYDDRDKLYRIITEINYSTGTCLTADNAPRVDVSTICQCTGLKDKNDNLIWENDVVRVCWQDNEAQCEEIAQVAWDKFGYYPWLDEYYCDGCDLFNEVRDIEVIGNIFDNKELVESEEK